MAAWKGHIELSDLFNRYAEDEDFEAARDGVVARLRASTVHAREEELRDLTDRLADTVDVEDFDAAWNDIADWADLPWNMVWLCTHTRTDHCPPLPDDAVSTGR